ncbi:diguanylate cyclase domain-containing protein [Desulfosporosinus shakirovi]|uniref:diguanylate cyclase domain-containing protein n=1 Tax=Desulfosporosinus shakirovi TaxID=2885154 RepID=UPI001E48EF3C|nr:diguanylate cyclase [Desulfosporosinus sp. SRJS8]
MSSGQSIISDPMISRGSKNPIIVIAAPIIKDNKVIGMVGGNIMLMDHNRIVTLKIIGEIGSAHLVQQDGLIITHNPKLMLTYNPLNDDDAAPDLKIVFPKMTQGETGFTRFSVNDEAQYLAYVPVPGVQWSMGVTVPATYVTNQLLTGILDKDGRLIFVNDFALGLTGYEKEEVIGESFFDIFIPDATRENAIRWFKECLNNKKITVKDYEPIQTKNGEIRYVDWNHTLLYDSEGNVTGVASIGKDITEIKKFQEKFEHMSFHDALTDLYNRTYFEEKMRLLEKGDSIPVGIIVCDINGLKLVNDSLGHSAGDKLLRLTASLIKKSFREEDLIYRIGGDEFAIILPKSELPVVEQACIDFENQSKGIM